MPPVVTDVSHVQQMRHRNVHRAGRVIMPAFARKKMRRLSVVRINVSHVPQVKRQSVHLMAPAFAKKRTKWLHAVHINVSPVTAEQLNVTIITITMPVNVFNSLFAKDLNYLLKS